MRIFQRKLTQIKYRKNSKLFVNNILKIYFNKVESSGNKEECKLNAAKNQLTNEKTK